MGIHLIDYNIKEEIENGRYLCPFYQKYKVGWLMEVDSKIILILRAFRIQDLLDYS